MNKKDWNHRIHSSSKRTDLSLASSALLGPSTASAPGTMHHPNSDCPIGNTTVTMNCLPGAEAAPSDPAHIPRRNLSEAFEELYIAAPMEDGANAATTTPGSKHPNPNEEKNLASANMISPTGVADLHTMTMDSGETNRGAGLGPALTDVEDATGSQPIPPYFHLHGDLKRDLSQAVINRVSFYSIIHDINKEATQFAANDDSCFARPVTGEDVSEGCSPLVEAVKGPSTNRPEIGQDMMQAALIDEERWLLSAIETRGDNENRPMQACPPTFLQAMGEREYENPLASLSNGSRTQLWKPSRSWWEAKSGKNPWIEPKSHNKRWRYLWPLIHYHKFLAKCIKKLKRNGVDVKVSVSPVSAFLREEVCAVSDHLASVSLFDSDEWMSCLHHFNGWLDSKPEAEANLRHLISKLYLRPLVEYGDIDSPLLRSQIDEHYLRAIAANRSQMEFGAEPDRLRHNKALSTRPPTQPRASQPNQDAVDSKQPHMHPIPSHVSSQPRGLGMGMRRARMGYGYPFQYWNQGWHPAHYHPHHQMPYGDDASVHSSVSGDGFSEYGSMYGGPPSVVGAYHPSMYHHSHPMDHSFHGGYDFSLHGEHYMHAPYHQDHGCIGYYGHPAMEPMAYSMHQDDGSGFYNMPPAPDSPEAKDRDSSNENKEETQTDAEQHQTPYKYDANKTPRSPYWGHLDATIAMGLSTPQTHTKGENLGCSSPEEGAEIGMSNAQPLLLRQSQFYGYGPVNNYAPPSPATQFLMSPQANFAMNYGYGYSPSPGHLHSHLKHSPVHANSHNLGGARASSLKQAAPGLSPAAANMRRKATNEGNDRESPSTVDTITESESMSEAT